ncbi:MAG: ROK family protein [Anaerolineales bacterium]|nr:ROK family protein [Anaerolineales bacterium]
MEVLGIDIGGSGIKGAPVDRQSGALLAPRCRIPTPQPAKPKSVANVVAEIAQHFEWQGPIGCGFPAAMRAGVAMTAANIHSKWIGVNAADLFAEKTACPVCVINDADAAGLAEMAFGAGQGRKGVVIVVTIGTGLGTALFTNGCLLPNAELGHIQLDGTDAEWRASDAARKREKLSWKQWGLRFNTYLNELEKLLWPDLFILGGGVSKQYEKYMQYLDIQAEVTPAQFLNEAGIVGAALAACSHLTAERNGAEAPSAQTTGAE